MLAAPQVLAARPAPVSSLPSAQQQAAETVSIVAGGDVMLDRGVRAQIRRHGSRALFSGIAPLLRRADFAFANLECPLALASPKVPKIPRAPSFKADPALAPALRSAGFDLLSLANNHALDCGSGGLGETLRALGEARLQAVGAGQNAAQALQQVVTRARGVRIAWVGACEFAPRWSTPDAAHDRGAERPSIALASEASLRAQVRAARARADVVVLSLHWGVEYQSTPSARQRQWARAALQAGADVVVGHHSHVLGPVEEVRLNGRRRLVAYSLGNLVFDSPRWNRRANQSALLRIVVSPGGLRSWKLVPLRIESCRPSLSGGKYLPPQPHQKEAAMIPYRPMRIMPSSQIDSPS